MSIGFIQRKRSETASWLRSKYPWAYLLLDLIAERARRTHECSGNLKIGEAYIGDYEAIGATRQQYRTALKILRKHFFIEIILTQKMKKSTTKSTTIITTNGTIVKLLDNDVWDINPQKEKQSTTTTSTTIATIEQPPSNHKQERKKEIIEKETTTSAAIAAHDAAPSFDPEKAKAMLLEFWNSWNQKDTHIKNYLKKGITRCFLALQFVTRDGFVVKKTLIASFVWALNDQPWLEEENQLKKLSDREFVEQYFVDGEEYNGAKCEINAQGILFYRGIKQGYAKFEEKTFKSNLTNALEIMGIDNQFKKTINIKEAYK